MMFAEFWKESWSAALVNHLWQSTFVMLVAWLLTLVLKRNQARTRYWVWMAASLKLLVPFSLLAGIGQWLRPASMPAIENLQIPGAMVTMAHPFVQHPQSPESFPISFPQSASVVTPAPHYGIPFSEILVAVWLCGLLILLLRWSRDWWRIRAALRSARSISLAVDVPVFLTPQMTEPGIVGILRPVLLLPEKIVDRLPPGQLRSILAHESCHVRRRDNLTAAIHMTVEAIFWFHPAVWWIEQRLIEERERACDEAVLQQGNEAEVYAESILNVCKFYTGYPIACMSGVAGSELKQRIFRIMTKQAALKLDFRRIILLSTVGMAVISVPVISGMLHIPQIRAQSAPAKPAGNIAANWQGIVHTDRDLRFVVKIAIADHGTLQATFYNLTYIDQTPGGIPAISATLRGSLLRFSLPFGVYQGTVSADGNSITGTWSQGPNSLPLNFIRATPETAWTIPQTPPRLPPMAADANPTFQVAAIRLSRPDEHGPRFWFEHRRFTVIHTSLSDLVKFSYGLEQRQIVGAPDWFNSERFDISAEPDGQGEPSLAQWQSMVKKLIADRFQFKFHYAKKELPVYLLTVAKTGPKLARSQASGESAGLGFGPPGNFGATNATMADFAQAMGQVVLDRPVVDRTGITGRFDFRLTWTPDESVLASQGGSRPTATENPDAPPDFFAAIQEELGLKIETAKAPVDVLMIDHVQKPSPN